ncbi:MAG: right-handed parallel beta-helix repeat-containing protein [Ignavibacteria bacterium]|nr:right-handed parallel beta-helix repeat-containing protein [Ignavibacteria bacterium]
MAGKLFQSWKLYYFFLISFVVFFISTANPVLSADYYISNDGSDGNNGTSISTPWATITKVNSMMGAFTAGDKILFRRGDTFFGQLTVSKSGLAGNEIIFGSYGTGELPVITGAKSPQNWIVHSGNIYKTTFTDTLSNLYVSGNIMNIARFPNSGWLRTDFGISNTGFNDAALNQVNGYWNGATCRIRTRDWSYEVKTVSNFSSGNVQFSSPVVNALAFDYGYFFDNKLNLLDAEGEFFYDIPNQLLYFYAPGGADPNTLEIQATVSKFNVHLNPGVKFVIIENLHLSHARDKGVEEANGTSITVRNCRISKSDKNGIRLYGTGHRIEDNIIEDVLDIGITAQMFDGFINGNTIRRTGLKPGYGGSSWGYIGLRAESATGTQIRYNIIDSSGYTGFRLGKNNIAEYNIIDYSCVILNDGGGIAIDNVDGLQIKNNIIKNSIGNKETAPAANYNLSYGIYFGNTPIKNLIISGNTIAHNRFVGIYVDNTNSLDNIQIRDNILYNNFWTQIKFSDLSASSYKSSYNTICKGNIFYSLSWKQVGMEHQMFHSLTFSDYGNFDSNYYANPYNEYVIRRMIMPPNYSSKEYRLAEWKSVIGEDLNSSFSQFSFDQYAVTDTLSSNYITNPHFNDTIAGWTTWPSGSSIARVVHPLLDGGSMRIRWNGIGFTENLAISNAFPTTKGSYYQVSMSVVGDQSGDFNVWGRSSLPQVYEMGLRRLYRFETFRRDYSFIFKPDTTDPATTFTTGMKLPDSLFYVDNVHMYKVDVQKIDSTEKSKLFINETSSPQLFSLNGISYKNLDGSNVNGNVIHVPPFSSMILVNDGEILTPVLNLNMLVEGMYDPNSQQTVSDTVRVYLRNINSPFQIVDSAVSVFNTSGFASLDFQNVSDGINYYIHVIHRNSTDTWSNSGGESFSSSVLNYDFTNDSSMTYGNNVIKKGVKFCFYSGDVDKDGAVDLSDLSVIDNLASSFAVGYLNSDLNYDLLTDIADLTIADNNAFNVVTVISP